MGKDPEPDIFCDIGIHVIIIWNILVFRCFKNKSHYLSIFVLHFTVW